MAIGDPLTVRFSIHAPLTREDLPGLSARVCRLFEARDPVVAYCDVRGFDRPDAVTVDALARLQLAARRRGCQVRLCNASPELRRLTALMGLSDVLPEDAA
jgi:ABC-type transporter Mla MlaB component